MLQSKIQSKLKKNPENPPKSQKARVQTIKLMRKKYVLLGERNWKVNKKKPNLNKNLHWNPPKLKKKMIKKKTLNRVKSTKLLTKTMQPELFTRVYSNKIPIQKWPKNIVWREDFWAISKA